MLRRTFFSVIGGLPFVSLFGKRKSVPSKGSSGGCELVVPGRGDCLHGIGLPGKSVPGQHDGPDDTVDAWGKPNGWCWQ